MNSITVAGSLGRDAEIKYMPNGDAVSSFSLADSQGKEKPTIWWNCSLFGKRAESLSQYLLKGGAVTVSGSVAEREWTDKDGQKRKSMDIRVSDIALQGGKREAGSIPVKTQGGGVAYTAPDDGSDIPFATSSMSYDMTTSKQRKISRYDY